MSSDQSKYRLAGVDDWRGLAALAVCLYHIEGSQSASVAPFSRFGFFGVYVFFVISGFILPYTMHLQRYCVADYGRFMLKRLARLYPPYLASIFLILLLAAVSARLPSYHGVPFSIEWHRLLANLTYSADVFGLEWYSLVYWTLGIEFQYYLLIGLAYPVLGARAAPWRLAGWVVLGAMSWIPVSNVWVFRFLPLFLFGVWAYWQKSGLLRRAGSWLLFCASLVLSCFRLGVEGTIIAGVTAVGIAYWNASLPPFPWLGLISYSLYLVHLTTYHYLVQLRDAFVPGFHAPFFQLVELIVSVAFAWVLFRVVEIPSMRSAAQIRYRKKT